MEGLFKGLAKETPPHARGRLEPEILQGGSVGNTPACAGKTEIVDILIDQRLRNTPACAGKTLLLVGLTLRSKKHPRMRGEDLRCIGAAQPTGETPPHARGRLSNGVFVTPGSGNTPACAGKTQFSSFEVNLL